MKFFVIICAFMMHLLVLMHGSDLATSAEDETSVACVQVRSVSPPGGEALPKDVVQEEQVAAREWVKANYESPAAFILTQLDEVIAEVAEDFLVIRGKASALDKVLPGTTDIVRNTVNKAWTDIQEYIQKLRVKAENKILQIWQENIGCLVVEATSSSLPETTSVADGKPSLLGRPAPLKPITGPSSPIRHHDVRSSPIGYSPKTAAADKLALQRQKEAARAFIDLEWDDFSGEPARKIHAVVNSLPTKLEQRIALLETIPTHLSELVLSIIEKTNTEIYRCMRGLAMEADKEILKICEENRDSLTS